MRTLLIAAVAANCAPVVAMAQIAPAPATAVARAKYNLDTPIQDIVADPAAKAVLDSDLPGVSTHESYDMFRAMSLKQLSGYAPEMLAPDVLAKVEKHLAAIR